MADFSLELKKDFMDEAFDLLDALEKNVLLLEKNPAEEKAIAEIFRIAHTLKGGAGTVGFLEAQEILHLLEDNLDLARKKKLVFNSHDISIILQSRDELEKMLSHFAENQSYQSDKIEVLKKHLIEIKSLAHSEPAAVKKVFSTDMKLSEYEISLIMELIEQKKNVFWISYRLNETNEMRDVSGFQIYALLKDTGEIIKMTPAIEEMETSFYSKIHFIVASDRDEDFIRSKTYLKELVSELTLTKLNMENVKDLEGLRQENTKLPEHKSLEKNKEEPDVQKRDLATLRVESWKIDELLNLLGELVITKSVFTELDSKFGDAAETLRENSKSFLSGTVKSDFSSDKDLFKEKDDWLKVFDNLFNFFDLYSESVQKLNRISGSLQESVMNMRMVPIQMVFSRFPRLIRDMAEKLGKKVDFQIEGVETEIDKGMVDDIFDPLIHILRNSVDHGLETVEERKKIGKKEEGKIILKAFQEGESIIIEVSDDGKGIDVDSIRKKALEGHFVSQQSVEQLSRKDLLSLIFLPGLSTAKEVTNLSGRGVGMDVVKKKIEEIGGNVGVATVKGKGTKITIRLPLTLAIIQGLLIVVEGMSYVIPVAAVEETVLVNSRDLKEINGKWNLEIRERFVPVIPLKNFFYQKEFSFNAGENYYCIVAKYAENTIGILVNEVIGEQDIVIKPLNTRLIKSPGISAATIIGNGEIGYIMDISQIAVNYFKLKA
jgi:two-component system chemotaxis sensor kinase CheA